METPDPVILTFNKDTFWFETGSIHEDPAVLTCITEKQPISRSDVVKILEEAKTLSRSTVYKHIGVLQDEGKIQEQDGLLSVAT